MRFRSEDVFMKLLYVEDEESMAEAVTDILVFHKYQVDTVYDGEEALEYARKEITRTLIMLSEEPQQSVKQQNEPPVQPEGNLKKLFDRFYRADTARTLKKVVTELGFLWQEQLRMLMAEVLQPK